MKIYSLLAISFLLSFGAIAHAQSYADYHDYGRGNSRVQLVKYFKPTQSYYGNGYVVRYGYSTTNPSAAGYTRVDANCNTSFAQYLAMTNSESRRDVALVKKTVTLPAKDEQQSKREVQPAPAKPLKPQP